ncbi:Uncharacterised protein [Escherichia coli]|uniref:hypothetical protein n=1 Tax=Escherichia coli TaxID=562 RepID=UPI001A3A2986|nr:hypothetical protein [Escherichia coli]VVZ32067.1 Uncharacterised protein [Escherichia coli]VWN20804.1 Uncharacterised protein [Escherichia coli]HBC8437500.1 hypothetical protein [Escherichia coli]HBC8455134.1 hypothetical protein [Escherichia coli]
MLPFVRMFDYGNVAPEPEPIKDVKGAQSFCAVLMTSGDLYVRGVDSSGCFGLGNNSGDIVTTWTRTFGSVDKVWVGGSVILIQTYDGNYYSSGDNKQIGVSSSVVNTWTNCTSFFDTLESDVKEIALSRLSISVLLENNTIWSSGYGDSGQLGNNTTTNVVGRFVQSTIPSGVTPEKIFAGSVMHSFIGTDGYIYYTGTVQGTSTSGNFTQQYKVYTRNTVTSNAALVYSNSNYNSIGIHTNSDGTNTVYNGGQQQYGALGNLATSGGKAYGAVAAARQPPGTKLNIGEGSPFYATFVITSSGIYASGLNSGSTTNEGTLGIGTSTDVSVYTSCPLPNPDIDMNKVRVICTNRRTYMTDGNFLYSTSAVTTQGGPSSTVFVLDDPRFS